MLLKVAIKQINMDSVLNPQQYSDQWVPTKGDSAEENNNLSNYEAVMMNVDIYKCHT